MGAQQSFSRRIFDFSTSVKELKWEDSFRTQESLQEIINNKTKITSSLIASKVGWYFMKFALTDEGRKMATANLVYDVIINHCAKHATTPESVQYVGDAIAHICFNNPDGKRLFSTPKTASALSNALHTHATTPESIEQLGRAIAAENTPRRQKVFGISPVPSETSASTSTDSAYSARRKLFLH